MFEREIAVEMSENNVAAVARAERPSRKRWQLSGGGKGTGTKAGPP
jgi:hypothetical protein